MVYFTCFNKQMGVRHERVLFGTRAGISVQLNIARHFILIKEALQYLARYMIVQIGMMEYWGRFLFEYLWSQSREARFSDALGQNQENRRPLQTYTPSGSSP